MVGTVLILMVVVVEANVVDVGCGGVVVVTDLVTGAGVVVEGELVEGALVVVVVLATSKSILVVVSVSEFT